MDLGLSDQSLASLNERFGHVNLDLGNAKAAEYDFDDGLDSQEGYVDNYIENASTYDPFSGDDTKYRFDISSVAMGNMDGKQLQFYEGLSYPTDSRGSCMKFDQSRMQFVLFIKALQRNERSQPFHPGTFPYSKAPLHAADIRAEVELTDIQSKGIGCVRDANATILSVDSRNTLPRRSYGSTDKVSIITRKVVLTMSLRRPPRFRVPIANTADNLDLFLQGDRKEITHRQGTSRDYVDVARIAQEAAAGPASIWAEQETFKVGQYLAFRFELCTSRTPSIGF